MSSDASKDGIGAVLLKLHNDTWRPVAYAARSMTSSECRYAQIEKECLSLMYACEKFHEYVYGTTFLGETDHKPLVSIHQKSLCDMTPRLQRMFLRLRRYDLKLDYTPGKFLVIADTLSTRQYYRTWDRSTCGHGEIHITCPRLHVAENRWGDEQRWNTQQSETLYKPWVEWKSTSIPSFQRGTVYSWWCHSERIASRRTHISAQAHDDYRTWGTFWHC